MGHRTLYETVIVGLVGGHIVIEGYAFRQVGYISVILSK